MAEPLPAVGVEQAPAPPALLLLPRDVVHHMLSMLPAAGLARLECTCAALRAQVKACEVLWQTLYKSSWRSRSERARLDAEAKRTTWRGLFSARMQVPC